MIYISQGHEKGIGLEVFFKSTYALPQHVLDTMVLYASVDSCIRTLDTLQLSYSIKNNFIYFLNKQIKISPIKASVLETESSQSLLEILSIIKEDDILITLPTSKDQLLLAGENKAGYTEFFRSYYNKESIAMIFKSHDLKVLLLTDHIALEKVPSKLTHHFIFEKTSEVLDSLPHYFKPNLQEIIFAGINPHAGEGGILGTEDINIANAIQNLGQKYPAYSFKGPLPGDTLHFNLNPNLEQLFVYAFHDQGLPFFKDKYGLFGINISLGLDFLRMSVDHGTAFSLYGKNEASSSGCLYVLNEAFKIHSNR